MASLDLSSMFVDVLDSETNLHGRERLLIVEDDPATRQVLAHALRHAGHAVDIAGHGREALDFVEAALAQRQPYALVLIDLQLGDITGLDVLRHVRRSCPHTQTMIVTGHADVGSAVEALRQGAQEYLLKPYRMEQLTVIVAKLLDARREALHNEALLADARRRVNELAILNHVGQMVTRSLDLDKVLRLVLEQIRDALQVESCSIALIEDQRLVFKVALGPAAEQVKAFTLSPGQGLMGHCVAENRPILVNHVHKDARHYREIDDETCYDSRSILCMPMTTTQDKVIGAIEVINRLDNQGFGQSDLDLLRAITVSASVAVENALLHERLAQRATELKAALDELQELDRLKSEFVQNISHELRTPLTFIKGYVELVQSQMLGELNEEQSQSLALVADQAEVLTRMVNDIILMQEYQMDCGQIRVMSLWDVLSQVVDEYRSAGLGHRVLLEGAERQAGDCVIQGHPEYLAKVLRNLVDNGLKFDPNHGPVNLALRKVEGGWEIQVSDQGIGIPESEWENIFERFYQVDGSSTRQYGGTGLGLAVAKEIIEAHGGHVWVQSQQGRGSTFGVFLPEEPIEDWCQLEKERVEREQ